MSNYEMGIDATNTALHSQGSASRENEKYMESLQARIEKMKVAWQSLAVSMGDAVISNSLINLIALATNFGNVFKWLTDTVGVLPVVLGVLSMAIYGLSAAFRAVMINITQTIAGILGIPVAAGAAAGGTNILARALQFLSGSANMAKGAIRGLLSATVVGGVFVALGAGLEWLINKFTDTKIAAEDTATSLNDTVAKVSDIKYLKELGDQYDKLSKQTNLSADEKTKLFKIESELEARFGISAKGLDGQTSAYEQNTKAIQQKVAALQEEINVEREKAKLAFESEESSIRGSISKKKQEAEEANRLLIEAKNNYDTFLKSKENGTAIDNNGLYSVTGFMNASLDPKNSNFTEGIQRLGEHYASNVKELQEKFDKANNELQQNLNKAAQGINGKFQGYLNILEAKGTEISPLMSSIFEGLASADASNNLSLTTQQLDQFFNAFNNKNISSIQDLDNVFRTLPPDLQLTGEQLEGVRLALLRIKFPAQLEEDMLGAADSAEVLGVNVGDLQDETKKTVDGIKELNNVLHQLKEGQSLSSESMFDLITKYPELRDNVYKTADGWRVEEDAVNALREAKLKKVEEDIRNEKASTATSLNNALQRIRGYGVEIKQIKNLQDAKNALNSLESELDSSKNPLGKKAGLFDPLFGAPNSVKEAANNYIEGKQAALTGAIIDTKNYISSAEQGEAEILKLMDMARDPNFGVSPSKEKKEKKGKKDKDDAAEKARKAREEAYNKDVARFKYLVEMQNWTTDDQIKGWDRIAQRHKQHLKENVDNERSINLEVKKLREQRFKDEMDALDKRVEKMRLSNATEVKMDQERLKTYKALATRKDLTPDQQADLKTKIFDTSKRIDDGRLSETNEYLAKRNKIVSEYNRLLSQSEKQQNLYNEGTAEYNQELVTQNQIRKKMIAFYNDEIYWITERLKKGDLTKAQTDALIAQMNEYKSALLDVSVTQRNMASKIADDTINKVIEAYKKAEKAALEAIDAQIKAEDERHDKVMKDYDEELNAFNAIVDAKLKELSRQKNEESYEKQLTNKQKEQAKIQQDINKLLLDDSDSGKYKRQQLEEELAKVIDEIQTMQNDRTYELRERELNDLKDQKKEQIDVNKKTEDNLHKVLKDSLDKKKKDEETYWKSILENDQYFTQLREDIINGSLDSITNSFDLFKTDVLAHLEGVEDGIQKSIIDKINEAQQSLSGLGYSSVATSGTNDSAGKTVSRPSPFDRMSDSDFNMYKTNKRIWEQSRDEQVKTQAALQNAKLREKYGIAKDAYTYGQIAQFETGGMTPAWGNGDGKFLLAHEKELILNKDDTSNMLKLVDITRNIMSNLNPFKSLQLATPAGSPTVESSNYEVNLYINNMTGSKEDANNVLSTVVKGLKKLGR